MQWVFWEKGHNMADTGETGCAWGCGILMVLFGLYWVFAGLAWYASAFDVTTALWTGLVGGAPVGAGVGALTCVLAGKYKEKADLGPLPYQSYWMSLKALRAKFLGK